MLCNGLMSAGRYVPPFRHFFLIPSRPDFALTSKCGMLSVEAAIINFIVFDLTQPSFVLRSTELEASTLTSIQPMGFYMAEESTSGVSYLLTNYFFMLPSVLGQTCLDSS